MRMIQFCGTVLGCCVLGACTTGSGTRTSADLYQPTDAAAVQILFEKPARPYKIIGQVSSYGAALASEDAVYRAMQKEAAELGAHAILIQGTGVQEVQQWGDENHKRAQALALRWTDQKKTTTEYSLTPDSITPTTPEAEQVIPPGVGKK